MSVPAAWASQPAARRGATKATNSHFHLKRSAHGRSQAGRTKLRNLHQGRAALPEAHEGGAGALQRAALQGLRRLRGGPQRESPSRPREAWSHWYEYATDFAQRSILFWDTLRERGNNFVEHNREGLPPLLHFDYETRRRRTHARPSGQLRAGAHRSAGGRDGRSEAAALRDHRPARRPRPRHRRLQGRLAGRRRAARRPSGLLRDLLPRSRAGPDAARRLRCRAAIREESARAASGRARSPRSSATARAAGRR